MLKNHYWPHQKVSVPTIIRSQDNPKGIPLPYMKSILLALLLACFLLPGTLLAKTMGQGARDAINLAPTAAGAPTFSVNAGFNTRYRSGSWIPVQVALQNEGADFTGTVSIITNNAQNSFGGSGSQSGYQVPITLANGAQKQVTLYV